MGQPVGVLVQLRVGQLPVTVDQGDLLRGTGRLCGEQLREPRPGGFGDRAVPSLQELVTLLRTDELQFTDGDFRVLDGVGQQPDQPVGDGLDGACVIQVGGVLDPDVQPAGEAVRCAVFVEGEGQVELGDLQRREARLGRVPGEFEGGVRAS
ncbi:hypothetical protein [Streptomyces sp. RKAG290]|uniref:hypothetical protein n=1 Tax=Streptomyces sp. RKAG290 TaxID=2888348 RepID=UPI002033F3B1|nr:hypothetical protein [Streptomyces sp. RKAG290]MCM2415405.1 hypothetical protein [Streptomyces sp. RKAG290]